MNLIVEKTRKNDVFEILITSSREAFRIYRTSQLASFFFSRVPAALMASLGSAALVVPSLEGLLAGVDPYQSRQVSASAPHTVRCIS